MSISNNSYSSADVSNLVIAQNIIANFLEQPKSDFSCSFLTGGSDENNIVKCTHFNKNYVIKFFVPKELAKNEVAWTQFASDIDIGPKLYFADVDKNFMLIDFVNGNSLVPSVANQSRIIQNIASSISKLHNSSAAFGYVSDFFDRIDTKYKKLNCSGFLKDILEKSMTYILKIKKLIANQNVSLAPCHNDLHPGNIYVSNNDKICLIDWGDSALGNPYYEIAAFFILNIINVESQKLFLQFYDKKLLSDEWQEYIRLLKQVVYFEFALNLLSGVQISKSELLHEQVLSKMNNINYYLNLLAKKSKLMVFFYIILL